MRNFSLISLDQFKLKYNFEENALSRFSSICIKINTKILNVLHTYKIFASNKECLLFDGIMSLKLVNVAMNDFIKGYKQVTSRL